VNEVVGVLDRARLLVVEDDFIISLELQSVLGAAGANIVATCQNASDALVAIEVGEVDAAILDIKLGSETAAPVALELARASYPIPLLYGAD
jgi:two-component SAPR family response regulator